VNATTQCKNCGADIKGRYCTECGQRADVSVPSLGKLLVDALEDLYNFDSRLWRSLTSLLFKPGRLTCEYIAGRRARYAPPFRMYVVVSLVFFFLVAALPDLNGDEDLAAEREPQGGFGIEIDEEGNGFCDLSGTEDWNPELRARLVRSCEAIAADKGNSFGRALVENIPLMMFLFIPIVAGGMKALYPLARRKYVEHLLFFLHFHAFFFLLATLGLLLSFFASLAPILDVPVAVLWIAGWIYLPIYLYVAMRRVYTQGRLATVFKYMLLGSGYFFALVCTLLGIVVYTALTL
jgi:hypothetical protein